ncbi:MAG: dioxygenase [Betaproteobacteria bacterium]|nr:dioxygenase [Betaproteobacteria bacterium]MCC7218862.1 dioxygenase [Burkholderiales bacterium]
MNSLPPVFLSHGAPTHAIEPGVAGRVWQSLGRTLPRPRAILMASAHWETALPMLTGSARPQTIHDFAGFPAELYALQYPAPGAPELAAEAVALLRRAGITAGVDGCRGLDHGAWVPLLHMYPAHDVPVVQISLQTEMGPAHHVALGRALAPLAADGVLIVGSGHATHNLRDWMANRHRREPLRYVQAFAEWLDARLAAGDTAALVDYRERAPDAERAHPTDEHFLPLHVAWGAAGEGARAERIVHAVEAGALAMDAWAFHRGSDP